MELDSWVASSPMEVFYARMNFEYMILTGSRRRPDRSFVVWSGNNLLVKERRKEEGEWIHFTVQMLIFGNWTIVEDGGGEGVANLFPSVSYH